MLNSTALILQTVPLLNFNSYHMKCDMKYEFILNVWQKIKIYIGPWKRHKECNFFQFLDALEEKGLALESTDAKLLRQGEAVLKTLQEMQKLTASQENQQRARIFYRFVSGLRSLHNSTLGPLVPKMMETSRYVSAVHSAGTPHTNAMAKPCCTWWFAANYFKLELW